MKNLKRSLNQSIEDNINIKKNYNYLIKKFSELLNLFLNH